MLDGHCDPRFASVRAVLDSQLADGRHHGVACTIIQRGSSGMDVWGGSFQRDTMAVSFSTTKGVAATAAHMAIERAGLSYDTPLCEVWEAFGKPAVTIRHALCHEAGVPQIHGEVDSVESMESWDDMVALMERLEPLWEPGTANGYHAINFGWLTGELVRRLDGRHLTDFLADEVAGPLELDGCYIGAPAGEHHRIAPLRKPLEDPFDIPPDSLTYRVLKPDGDIVQWLNTPGGMSCCGPGFSGAFTARSLATMYARLDELLKPDTLAEATRVQNKRPDLVLALPIYWRLGYMSGGSSVSPAGPNRSAFGHNGFGGSVAFSDPSLELAFALTCDQLDHDILAGTRLLEVVHAAIACASDA